MKRIIYILIVFGFLITNSNAETCVSESALKEFPSPSPNTTFIYVGWCPRNPSGQCQFERPPCCPYYYGGYAWIGPCYIRYYLSGRGNNIIYYFTSVEYCVGCMDDSDGDGVPNDVDENSIDNYLGPGC